MEQSTPPPPPLPSPSNGSASVSASSSSSSSSSSGWMLAAHALLRLFAGRRPASLPFSEFLTHAQEGRLAEVLMGHDRFEVRMKPPPAGGKGTATTYVTRVVPYMDRQKIIEMLDSKGVAFGTPVPSWGRRLLTLLLGLAPFLYLALVYRILNRTLYNPSDSVGKEHRTGNGQKRRVVTFKDVAGIEQAKLELVEVVQFLRDRSRFVDIGARLPKGILLSGPPGTGKTLLARAVANEAGVPFISCSASDFVEMLVGRGAARVRDLFARGMAASPCIIFIDELDALAKTRGAFSSNDEREQTLNQLLTEMDGFDASENSVLVIAATNRPETLDTALIRPGRFDRHVHVDLPDTRGRRAILAVHARNIRLANDVDLHRLAVRTRGCSGAELANITNEAALLAVRAGCTVVSQTFFEAAVQRNMKARELSAVGATTTTSTILHVHTGSPNNNHHQQQQQQQQPFQTP